MKKEWNDACTLFSCIFCCDYVCFTRCVCIVWGGYVAYNVAIVILFDFLIVLDAVDNDFNAFNAAKDTNHYLLAKEKD